MANKKNPNQFTIVFPQTTDTRIIQFMNKQTTKVDSIAYLIEEEIKKNGIRDLQTIIPAVRTLPEDIPSTPDIIPTNVGSEKTDTTTKKTEEIKINSCFND